MRSADHPEIRFEVAYDFIESVNFAEFHGFYDVTCNCELDFSGRTAHHIKMRLGTFLRLFFKLFLMAISINIGQVPHCDNAEQKISSKINFSVSERHRWALAG